MSNPAKVVITLYPGFEALDVNGPASVFSEVNRVLGDIRYQLSYVSLTTRRRFTAANGLEVIGTAFDQAPEHIDLLLVPGSDQHCLERILANRSAIRRVAELSDRCDGRVASVCTGTFLLAEAGLLNGKIVNTHWAGITELQRRYPRLQVKDDGLFSQDGHLWTSAGVLSGVDMALAMVAEDVGGDVALTIAQRLVVHLVRDGKQSQFSTPLALQAQSHHPPLAALVAFLQSRLQVATPVAQMADHLNVSERSLHRLCRDAYGKGPGQLYIELKLEHAKQMLREDAQPIKTIADECGFAGAAALSKAFGKAFGTTPGRYRASFRQQTVHPNTPHTH